MTYERDILSRQIKSLRAIQLKREERL